jgi:alpha-tubulin suppressor-like RCC1 family protein
MNGQLGDGTDTNKSIPTQIGTATNWKNIAAGANHSLATKTDGTLWAWGLGGSGQLGNGNFLNSLSPVQVGTATNWSEIAAGGHHSIAIKTDGTLWAWGNNYSGQLGDGTISNRTVPIQINCPAALGNSEFELEAYISLYPNPVQDILYIELDSEINSVEIYNLQGQKVKAATVKQINVNDLKTGAYLIKIQNQDNQIVTKKFVKL